MTVSPYTTDTDAPWVQGAQAAEQLVDLGRARDAGTGLYASTRRWTKGHRTALHTHAGDLLLHALDGVLVVHVDGQDLPLRAGTGLFVPAGTAHYERAADDCTFLVAAPAPFTFTVVGAHEETTLLSQE